MTKDKLDIGRQAYERPLTKEETAWKYGVSIHCINVYVKAYMRSIVIKRIPAKDVLLKPSLLK